MNPLIRAIPAPLVRFFARPYVAGDSLATGLEVAAQAWAQRGLLTTLDLLAEGIEAKETVAQNEQTYLDMIEAVAKDPRFVDPNARPTLSLKLSSYTTAPLERGGDAAGAKEAVLRIAVAARAAGVHLTLDMEGSPWTDFTLALLAELHAAGHTHVGCVLQTRLHRTRADLDRLPEGQRVRLVIGIYQEPESLALIDKPEMKERLLEYAELLLARGHYVELATHDPIYVRRFIEEVVPRARVGTDRYEVQMLYGVPRLHLQRELVEQGVRVRLYVPFAVGWPMAIAYLRRRLDEYPAMMFIVLKDLFGRA